MISFYERVNSLNALEYAKILKRLAANTEYRVTVQYTPHYTSCITQTWPLNELLGNRFNKRTAERSE